MANTKNTAVKIAADKELETMTVVSLPPSKPVKPVKKLTAEQQALKDKKAAIKAQRAALRLEQSALKAEEREIKRQVAELKYSDLTPEQRMHRIVKAHALKVYRFAKQGDFTKANEAIALLQTHVDDLEKFSK